MPRIKWGFAKLFWGAGVYKPCPELQSLPSGYLRLGPSPEGVREAPNMKRLHGSRLNLATSDVAPASASKCAFRHGARLALPFPARHPIATAVLPHRMTRPYRQHEQKSTPLGPPRTRTSVAANGVAERLTHDELPDPCLFVPIPAWFKRG